jgi:hypothetical protein
MVSSATTEGFAPFAGHQTWYKMVGDLEAAQHDNAPAPLVTRTAAP